MDVVSSARRLLLPSLVAGLVVSCALGGEVIGRTGRPRVVSGASMPLSLLDWEGYERLAEQRSFNPRFRRLNGPRERYPGEARFAILPLGDRSVGLVVSGDPDRALTFHADLDGDGALANDVALTVAVRNGRCFLPISAPRVLAREGVTIESTFLFGLVCDRSAAGERDLLFQLPRSLREGTLRIRGREIAFGVLGEYGEYDQPHHEVFFDLDRDGKLNVAGPRSSERFAVAQGRVHLRGRGWSYRVDPSGDTLTLEPVGEPVAERSVLEPGSRAPRFTVRDIDGLEHRLDDYRGRFVLLTFWGTWCAPCVAEAATLIEAYRKYTTVGLDILGIHQGGTEQDVRSFIGERDMPWPQVLESPRGAMLELFRVNRYPTNVLVGPDGRILSNDLHVRDLSDALPSPTD